MVGSYPRPAWFTQQLAGRDVLEAFKIASHAEAFHDATRVVIKDQDDAGLDILTDGQMWFDDYYMGIGSFLWYWLERTKGFSSEKLPHPARAKAKGRDIVGARRSGRRRGRRSDRARPGAHGADLSMGAAPHATSRSRRASARARCSYRRSRTSRAGPVKNRYDLSRGARRCVSRGDRRARRRRLQARPARRSRRVDADLSGDKDWDWVRETVDRTMADIPAGVEKAWHFCLGNVWGNKMEGMTAGGYREVVPHYHDVEGRRVRAGLRVSRDGRRRSAAQAARATRRSTPA